MRFSGWAILIFSMSCVGCTPHRSMLVPDDNLAWSDHYSKGKDCLARGEREKATEHFLIASERNSSRIQPWLALGQLAFESGKLKAAEGYYRKALSISPRNALAINNLARIYLAEGRPLNGIDIQVEDALETAGPLTPYLWDTLSRIAIREGRYSDAQFALHNAETTAPSDPEFEQRLANSRQKLSSLQ
jgi:cytochrome c-type biogenesis protein CcmH/NrfG